MNEARTHFPLRAVEDAASAGTANGLRRRQLIRGLQGIEQLTPRERELLGLMAEGMSNRAICEHLMLSAKTVETHVGRVFDKLGLGQQGHIHRRVMATRIALTNDALRQSQAVKAEHEHRHLTAVAR